MQRHFLVFAGAAALFIPLLLIADRRGLIPQLALGAATAAFLWLFARGSNEAGRIGTAILIATTGEVVLSLGWGLYSYRNALIPLYVPFGHGVFYALAAESARQPALRRLEGGSRAASSSGEVSLPPSASSHSTTSGASSGGSPRLSA